MVDSLFCYGTLQFPEVMRLVAGGRQTARPAWLAGHARYRVRGEVYPGVIAEVGGRVDGIVYHGLDGVTLARIDRYESDEYRRCLQPVETADGPLDAWVYVVSEAVRMNLDDAAWDRDHFARHHLAGWLDRLARGRSGQEV